MSHTAAPTLDPDRRHEPRALHPVDLDAAADAARMVVALHERVERQLQQDHLLDLVMVELGGMVPTDRGYDGKVRVLVQVFRQHARDAEALLLPKLRRRLGPAERELLGRRVLERVGQLEGRPRPGW